GFLKGNCRVKIDLNLEMFIVFRKSLLSLDILERRVLEIRKFKLHSNGFPQKGTNEYLSPFDKFHSMIVSVYNGKSLIALAANSNAFILLFKSIFCRLSAFNLT